MSSQQEQTLTDQVVFPFPELQGKHAPIAGAKAGTLARLYQAGYPVPDGLILTPQAFQGDELLPEAWETLRTHLTRLRQAAGAATAFAVRSSALSEDSASASFAGQYETVLNVRTDEQVQDAIRAVRRSVQTQRAKVYGQAKAVESGQEMAVIVQQMVQATIAGVLFTADPLTGARSAMVGNFVHGPGELLVSGKANAEAFSLDVAGGSYRGPSELAPFAARFLDLGTRLTRELTCPQDIEWAIADGVLYVLQARPITALPSAGPGEEQCNDSLRGDYLWSNVNFGEAVPEVMTPLSWGVLQLVFEQWTILPGYRTSGNIGGRPYLNLSVLASMLRALGKRGQGIVKALEGALYTRLPAGIEIPRVPLSRWAFLSIIPNLIRLKLKERRALKDLPTYLAQNAPWCDRMREKITTAQAPDELLSLWHSEIWPHVAQGLWVVMGTVTHCVGYTMRLRRQLVDLIGPGDADALLSGLSSTADANSGSGPLASLGPLIGLTKVARGEMDRQAYLDRYGHRGPSEFELSVPRPAEDPVFLDQQIEQLRQSQVDVEALLARQRSDRDAAWNRLQAAHPSKTKSIQRRLQEAAIRARMREDTRSEYVRDRWLVRTFALRAGQLTGLGDGIFFLSVDEMLSILAGNQAAAGAIPARRELYNRFRALPPYPSVIRGHFDPFRWAKDPHRHADLFDAHAQPVAGTPAQDSSGVIDGSAASAGCVEGVVRRLNSPEDGSELQPGEILVIAQADIAWTLLFPRVAAIVTDVGAPLSHAAIVARELGIPAVMGCVNATARLKTGDRVRVDGGRGTVERITESPTESAGDNRI